MDTLTKIGLGATGFIGTELVPVVAQAAEIPPSGIMQAITQLIIAVATIISLFRKPKKT